MFQEGSEGELLVLSDLVSEKSECSQKNVLDNEGVLQGFLGSLLFSVGLNEGSETEGVSAVDLLLEESGKFGDTFEFGDLVFKDLVSEGFKELLLFSFFVFNFFLNDLGEFSGKLFLVGD